MALAWGREGGILTRQWWSVAHGVHVCEFLAERGFFIQQQSPFYQVCTFVIVCVETQFRGCEQRTGGGGSACWQWITDSAIVTYINNDLLSCILYNLLLQYGLLKFYCNIAKLLQFKQNTVAEVHIYVNINPACPHSHWSSPCYKVSGLD